jgi:hypothetical protein
VLVCVSDLLLDIAQGAIASPFRVATSNRKNTRRKNRHLFIVLNFCVLSPAEGSVNAVLSAMSWILDFLGAHCGVTSMVA